MAEAQEQQETLHWQLNKRQKPFASIHDNEYSDSEPEIKKEFETPDNKYQVAFILEKIPDNLVSFYKRSSNIARSLIVHIIRKERKRLTVKAFLPDGRIYQGYIDPKNQDSLEITKWSQLNTGANRTTEYLTHRKPLPLTYGQARTLTVEIRSRTVPLKFKPALI